MTNGLNAKIRNFYVGKQDPVYLGDRILVLTNKPTHIKEIVQCDMPHPRDIAAPEFIEMRNRITDLIKWW